MRHRKYRYQLNRFTSWRKATLSSTVRNLLIHQRIKTSIHKAKAIRPLVEELISLAKQNTLISKRRAAVILNNDHRLIKQLFDEIGPRFQNRIAGFSRIINLGPRRGDNSRLVIFELTEIKEKPKKVKKKQEEKAETPQKPQIEKPTEEKKIQELKPKAALAVEEKKPKIEKKKKPKRPFFKGIRNIFKKERDSL